MNGLMERFTVRNGSRGLTLSAEFWHIDLRSIAALPMPNSSSLMKNYFTDVIRDPTTGAITDIINPPLNLTRRRGGRSGLRSDLYPGLFELGSWRFWQIYLYPQWDVSVRFELQISPDSKRFGLSGIYVFIPTLTGSLPHTRAFASAFWDGPAGTWLAGVDIGATVHYTGQYEDENMILTGSSQSHECREVGLALGAENTGVDYARPDRVLYV